MGEKLLAEVRKIMDEIRLTCKHCPFWHFDPDIGWDCIAHGDATVPEWCPAEDYDDPSGD
jgi:hypothetical protein